MHSIVKFNQKAWLKPYIDMNTKLWKAQNDFEKYLFKSVNNSVFGKTMENIKKHWDIIRLVTTDKRSDLVLEPNYRTKKWFSKNLIAIEMNT